MSPFLASSGILARHPSRSSPVLGAVHNLTSQAWQGECAIVGSLDRPEELIRHVNPDLTTDHGHSHSPRVLTKSITPPSTPSHSPNCISAAYLM